MTVPPRRKPAGAAAHRVRAGDQPAAGSADDRAQRSYAVVSVNAPTTQRGLKVLAVPADNRDQTAR